MCIVLRGVVQVGYDLDSSFLLFGFPLITINIHIVLLISFGRKICSFLKDTEKEAKTWKELTTSHNFTLNIPGIGEISLHEDMQNIKLGGDVGSHNCHIFPTYFPIYSMNFLPTRPYLIIVTTLI